MFCSKCGNKLNNSDVFCSQCGNKIAGTTQSAGQAQELKAITNKCNACGGTIKEVAKGRYLCEYCGSEYITNDAKEILESKLTERELIDIFHEAAQHEINNRFYEELQCFLRAIEKAPDNTILLVKLGRAYRRNNLHAKALECYEKAIEINPSYAVAYTNLCTLYVVAQDYKKAEECARKGISLMEANRLQYTNDDYAIALSNCALAVGKRGNLNEAKALLKKAEANGYKNGAKVRQMLGIKKGLFG